jgi:hypothetical protein
MLAALVLTLALGQAEPGVVRAPPDPRDDGPDRVDVADYPPVEQRRYELFRVKCNRCHSVARPIASRFDHRQWAVYSKRMARRPNSAINDAQLDEIYAFLRYYSTRMGDDR